MGAFLHIIEQLAAVRIGEMCRAEDISFACLKEWCGSVPQTLFIITNRNPYHGMPPLTNAC